VENLFQSVNAFFAFIAPISDFLWDFPTNFKVWSQIPVLGQFPFAILLLVGVGIHFSIRTRFIQTMNVGKIVRIMLRRQSSNTGVSALASFMLGLAMRAGPGNIVGITGAISVGGPGALFWMWVAAFFGMATAFMESTLAQLFKEKKHDEFVGGLPFYGRRVLGDRRIVGTFLSLVFIVYALFNVPPQTFNVFTAIGTIADTVTGTHLARQSTVYYAIAACLIVACSFIIMGGIRPRDRVHRRARPHQGRAVLPDVAGHHRDQPAADSILLSRGDRRCIRAACAVRRRDRHCACARRQARADVERSGTRDDHDGSRDRR
jgi:AGCS family alanine or glycine:cation symporter